MAPAPPRSHGRIDHHLSRILGPAADTAGLFGNGPLNLGEPDDYRVPDASDTRDEAPATFLDTVAIVVEIVSPNDETFDTLAFSFSHGVEEILIVEPRVQSVCWLTRGEDGFADAAASTLLGLPAADIAAELRWPPVE